MALIYAFCWQMKTQSKLGLKTRIVCTEKLVQIYLYQKLKIAIFNIYPLQYIIVERKD